jgi:hypothetical protein
VPSRSSSIGSLLDWPDGIVRLGVLLVVLTVLVAAAVRYPQQIRAVDAQADANARLSFADRDVAGGNGIFPEQRALYEIIGRIPATASYRVSIGPARPDWTPLTSGSAELFLHYWLLPRRPSADGRWLICIGCDRAEYPGAREVWSGEAGVSLLRLEP